MRDQTNPRTLTYPHVCRGGDFESNGSVGDGRLGVAVILSIPLIYFLYDSLPKDELSQTLMQDIEQAAEANEGITFDQIELETDDEQPTYTITLLADQSAYDLDLSAQLDELIESRVGKTCRVRVIMHRLNVSE